MPARLDRRTWLRRAAATVPAMIARTAALDACGHLPRGAQDASPSAGRTGSPTSRASSAAASRPLDPVITGDCATVPSLAAAHNRAQSRVHITRLADFRGGSVPLWLEEIAQDQFTLGPKADDYAATYEAMNAALVPINFNANIMLPGSVDAFTSAGNIYALPVTLAPWCVRWRSDAFAAAGLSAPSAQWALADFQTACDALQSVVRASQVHGLVAPLAPMVGECTHE